MNRLWGSEVRGHADLAVLRTVLAFLAIGLGVLIGGGALFGQEGYRVIANPAAGVSVLTRQDVARVFLKEQTTWPNGNAVVPVDLSSQSDIRERFSRDVHGRSTAAVRAYWQKQMFSGRQVPPVEEATESDVIAFVAGTAGAIGYVSASAGVPPGVVAVALKAGDPAAAAVVFDGSAIEEAPERVSMPPVRVPSEALRRRESGTATLQFVVSETGQVEPESVMLMGATSDAFAAAAKEALVQAVFTPGRMRGRAVRTRVEQTFRFAPPGAR